MMHLEDRIKALASLKGKEKPTAKGPCALCKSKDILTACIMCGALICGACLIEDATTKRVYCTYCYEKEEGQRV